MNHQNIESLAACEGRQPTTDGFPHKDPIMTYDFHGEFFISPTHIINYSFLLDLLLNFDKPKVCTTVCLGLYQMKHQTRESPETMHRSSVDSPTKGR